MKAEKITNVGDKNSNAIKLSFFLGPFIKLTLSFFKLFLVKKDEVKL